MLRVRIESLPDHQSPRVDVVREIYIVRASEGSLTVPSSRPALYHVYDSDPRETDRGAPDGYVFGHAPAEGTAKLVSRALEQGGRIGGCCTPGSCNCG